MRRKVQPARTRDCGRIATSAAPAKKQKVIHETQALQACIAEQKADC